MKGQRNQVKSNNESNAGAYLKSILRETFRSITRNSLMSAASVLSILSALLILGIFIVFSVNVEHLTNSVAQSLELKVYLTNGLTQEQITNVENKLKANDQITEVSYISAEQALADFSASLKEYSGLLNGYNASNNPMQASFNVKIKDPMRIKEVKAYAETLSGDGVSSVKYGEEYVDALTTFNRFTTIFCVALIIVLSVVSLFIIYNTIKLTCFARRREIRVMRYVGASNWYIRAPFVLEGTILGFIAAILALLLIRLNYFFLLSYVQQAVYLPMNAQLVPPQQIMGPLAIFSILYGVIIGSVGSLVAMRKFLDV